MKSILDLHEDSLLQVSHHLEIVSFIYFLCTCKYLHNQRKAFVRHMNKPHNYAMYDPDTCFISVLMNSYINLDIYALPCFNAETVGLIELVGKLNEVKFQNTMKIINYHASENRDIMSLSRSSYITYISSMYCKMVCQKYNYVYTDGYYDKVFMLLYDDCHNVEVNLLELCAIAYHIKNRKYQSLLHSLKSVPFKTPGGKLIQTMKYMLKIVDKDLLGLKMKAAIVSVIYSYIAVNIHQIKSWSKLSDTIIYKYDELHVSINEIKGLPNYIKTHIINNMKDTVKLLK
jgi:hypothetical protein